MSGPIHPTSNQQFRDVPALVDRGWKLAEIERNQGNPLPHRIGQLYIGRSFLTVEEALLLRNWLNSALPDETGAPQNYHCNICGGDVSFPEGAKPSMSIGPGNKTRLKQTDAPDDGPMKGSAVETSGCRRVDPAESAHVIGALKDALDRTAPEKASTPPATVQGSDGDTAIEAK